MQKLILFLTCLLTMDASMAQNSTPCSVPEATQFDFWVGDWDLTWNAGKDSVGKGRNVIEKILGSCVLSENFEDPISGFAGKSYSLYDQTAGKWKQTWVDNAGAYLDFVGQFADGKMILTRTFTGKNGKDVMQRMVWYDIRPTSFEWNWEASTDGGKTWKVNWQIHYQKKKKF